MSNLERYIERQSGEKESEIDSLKAALADLLRRLDEAEAERDHALALSDVSLDQRDERIAENAELRRRLAAAGVPASIDGVVWHAEWVDGPVRAVESAVPEGDPRPIRQAEHGGIHQTHSGIHEGGPA